MSLRLTTLSPGGSQGWDLTDAAEGLTFSNVNPGGDEACSFRLKRQWFAGAPEIAEGNLVRVTDGPSVLWQGRIEENDRGLDRAEEIDVTAYGLGIRLKDDETFQMIYADRDLGAWGQSSRQRRIDLETAPAYMLEAPQIVPDAAQGLPAVLTRHAAEWSSRRPLSEAMYDAGQGNTIAAIYTDNQKTSNLNYADANWSILVRVADDDRLTNKEDSADINADQAGYFSPTARYRYAFLAVFYQSTPGGAATSEYGIYWRKVAVYGDHGLTRRGTDPGGFYDGDIVGHIVSQVAGIVKRRIDSDTTFVIPHLAFKTGVTHQQALEDVARFVEVDWGVWGPDSVLDTSTDGYLDWKQKDTTTAHWYARRADCDDVDLHTELRTVYDTVNVVYKDTAGADQVETRTTTSRALQDAGITGKTAKLQAGVMTQAGAQQLGDVFLALSSGEAPARGSVQISRPVRHRDRGTLPPHFMRADGANVRIPDVLPSRDALALDTTPDRRTTFPIKRVQVDAGGETPKVRVDLDQTNDLLSLLQARLDVAGEVAIGR